LNIAVYGGRGAHAESREAIQAFLSHAGIDWQPILPHEMERLSPDKFDVLYVPGGWAIDNIREIAPLGKRAIRQFVQAGKSYIGVCAGAYFAADIIRWQGRLVEYDLDLFNGLAEGPIDAIQTWRGWRLTELELVAQHPVNKGQTRQTGLYWGGPAFYPDSRQQCQVLGCYAATGEQAAIAFEYGRGRVLLMGCHLELGWDEQSGRFDREGGHGAQWPWLERALRWLVAPRGPHHKCSNKQSAFRAERFGNMDRKNF
jgi:glutamine amidotransferase-like uncharacterized protein